MNSNCLEVPIINNTQKSGERVLGLDIMRIVLAFLILFFHSQIYLKCNYYFLNNFVRMGAIAMTGFMLLSGYSLHLSYSKIDLSKIKEIRIFYLKRLISIVPMYYTVVLLYSVCSAFNGSFSIKDNLILFPAEILGIQSTFSTLFPYLHNAGTWFISCILVCYLAYPFLQVLFSQLTNKTKIIILLCLSFILLYSPFVQHAYHLNSIYENPFFRLIEFSIGVIIAQLSSSFNQSRFIKFISKPLVLIVILILFVIAVSIARVLGVPADYMLFNWIALPFFILLIFSLGNIQLSSILSHTRTKRIIIYLSSISFVIYLCQVLPLWDFCTLLCSYIGDNNLVKIIVSIFVCVIWAIIIHEAIEKPVSKYLRKKLI